MPVDTQAPGSSTTFAVATSQAGGTQAAFNFDQLAMTSSHYYVSVQPEVQP